MMVMLASAFRRPILSARGPAIKPPSTRPIRDHEDSDPVMVELRPHSAWSDGTV